MKKMMMIAVMGLVVAVLAGCSDSGAYPPSGNAGAPAANAAPNVQDLVGARGSSGEMALEQRGFEWVKTDKTSDSAYSYWQHKATGQCLTVRTVDGRYASLVPSPSFDCRK